MGGLSKVELFLKKHLTTDEYEKWVRNSLLDYTEYAVSHGMEESLLILDRTWKSNLLHSQDVIAQSFVWRNTSEGHNFWERIDWDIRRAWRAEQEANDE
jgi:hypothetical protein